MKLIDEITEWFRNPKLGISQAILFSAIFLALVAVIGSWLIDQSVWTAIGAVGTCFAVLVALFGESFWRHKRRPILQLAEPGYTQEYLRIARMVPTNNSGAQAKLVGNEEFRCYIDIQLENIGQAIAKNCQPLLTAVWQKTDNKWETIPQWVPIGLDWIFDEYKRRETGMPTEEKDIVPHKPYIFNLGYVSTQKPEKFCLAKYLIPTGQPEDFGDSKNCYEITVFAENADTIKNYFTVQFETSWDSDTESIMKGLAVSKSDYPPRSL